MNSWQTSLTPMAHNQRAHIQCREPKSAPMPTNSSSKSPLSRLVIALFVLNWSFPLLPKHPSKVYQERLRLHRIRVTKMQRLRKSHWPIDLFIDAINNSDHHSERIS